MEQDLKQKVENPDFLAISGSTLYGTNHENSDLDLRGFVLPPDQYLLGIKTFEQASLPDCDHVVYSMKRFLQLTMSGDPQCTELLFVNEEHVKSVTDYGRKILSLREDIVSNKIFNRIMGYSNSEWRKAMGQKLIIEDRTKKESDIIMDIRNTYKPDKEDMDSIVSTLMKNKKTKLVPSVKGLGGKRKAEVENYGYCISSASHAIRLCLEVTQLMKEGYISFPSDRSEFLRDIKLGKVSKDKVIKEYEDVRKEAESARESSVLRSQPNSKKVWLEYYLIVKEFLLKEFVN